MAAPQYNTEVLRRLLMGPMGLPPGGMQAPGAIPGVMPRSVQTSPMGPGQLMPGNTGVGALGPVRDPASVAGQTNQQIATLTPPQVPSLGDFAVGDDEEEADAPVNDLEPITVLGGGDEGQKLGLLDNGDAAAAPGLLNQPEAGPGLLSRGGGFRNFLSDNSDALIMAGAGMMSGGLGSGRGFAGFARGAESDTKRKDRRTSKEALDALLPSLGNLSPEMQAYLQANPEAAQAVIAQSLKANEPASTDDLKEYAFYRQQAIQAGEEPMPFMDFVQANRRAGATSNNVTVNGNRFGTIPPGYQLIEDPATGTTRMEPIQGSPAAREATAAAAQAQTRTDQRQRSGDAVLSSIKEARELAANSSTFNPAVGFGAEWAAENIGGSNAADMAGLINTIGANIAFDRLDQMRAASPTGGALGNITERELAFLRDTMGSLAQSQSRAQFLRRLDDIEKAYSEILRKAAAYPNASQFGFDGSAAPEQQVALPEGVTEEEQSAPDADPLGIR